MAVEYALPVPEKTELAEFHAACFLGVDSVKLRRVGGMFKVEKGSGTVQFAASISHLVDPFFKEAAPEMGRSIVFKPCPLLPTLLLNWVGKKFEAVTL